MGFVDVAAVEDVSEGALLRATVQGRTVLLTRVGEDIAAFSNKCPHLGLSLAGGQVSGGVVRCPFHGSTFDVRSGENLDWCEAFAGVKMPSWSHKLIALGRRPAGLAVYPARMEGGRVQVDLPSA